MSKARLIITAITVENRSVAEVVKTHGVSRSRVNELLARYRAEGEAAFEPRSWPSPALRDVGCCGDFGQRIRWDSYAAVAGWV